MNEPFLMPLPHGHVDLRHILDDKRILKNPHKGWYIHYVDNGFVRKFYRDGIPADDDLSDIPGINHLYLRIDWSDIEPEEGKFDWSRVDEIMDHRGKQGFKFSFRFCTYVPSNSYATPKFVVDAGAKGTMIPVAPPRSALIPAAPEPKFEPDYGDPIFLEKLENFIAECGRKLDNDPRVEFVDVGTFGTYGEGHTSSGSGKKYPAEVVRAHIDMHLRHFRNVPLIMNDDLFSTAASGSGAVEGNYLADYAAAKGLGARDDSIVVDGVMQAFGYDTLKNTNFFDKFYETAPVDLEMAHYHLSNDTRIQGGYPMVEALRRTHATYAGFHGYPRDWYKDYKHFTDYVANRIGYWYFLTDLELDECVSGMFTYAKLYVENRGFARAYNPYTLIVRVKSESGAYELYRSEGTNLLWHEGVNVKNILKLDFKDVPRGKYDFELGMFEADRPVEFAVKANVMRDGFARLCEVEVK